MTNTEIYTAFIIGFALGYYVCAKWKFKKPKDIMNEKEIEETLETY